MNITEILKIKPKNNLIIKADLYNELQYYLTYIQMSEITIKKKYDVEINNSKKKIKSIEFSKIFLIPWYMYRINSSIDTQYKIFNLKQKKFININTINKIHFNKTGGIIETNYVAQLVRDYFFKKELTKCI